MAFCNEGRARDEALDRSGEVAVVIHVDARLTTAGQWAVCAACGKTDQPTPDARH